MRKINLVFLVIFLAAISGCNTTPVSISSAEPIPAKRIYAEYDKYQGDSPGTSKVSITRDSGFLGVAGAADLFLDGSLIATFRTSEGLVLHIMPGEYLIGLAPNPRMNSGEIMEEEMEIEEGKDYYYRIRVDPYKGLEIRRSSQIN